MNEVKDRADTSSRGNPMEEGKMMHLRNEAASVVGAGRVRAGLGKKELKGRQGA